MELSRQILGPTYRAAAVSLRQFPDRPRASRLPPVISPRYFAPLSTTSSRWASDKPKRQAPAVLDWITPKKKPTSPPPPPPTVPNSPPDVDAPPMSSGMISWADLQGGRTPNAKQRDQARQAREATKNINSELDMTDLDPSRRYIDEGRTRIKPYFRHNPESGKLIQIKPGKIDLQGALSRLSLKVGQNRIQGTLNKQREHERPGLRRKRLRSERWKRRFGEAFKATVRRANALAKMGW